MVNKKISELDPAATITGTETVPLLQAGATKAATVAQLLASVLGTNPVAGLSTLKQLADAIGDDPTYAADLVTTLATKAPAMTATAVKTAAYTAAAGEIVPVDATAAAVPIALPATPTDRARVTVKKIDASTNPVTITTGGTDVLNKAGGSTSASLTLLNQSTTVQYTAAAGIWYVIAADAPVSQLDGRYLPITKTPALEPVGAGSAYFRAAVIGDSTTAGDLRASDDVVVQIGNTWGAMSGGGEQKGGPKSWFTWMCLFSNGRITAHYNGGVASDTTTGMLARYATVLNSGANLIFIGDAHNDFTGGTAEATTRANIISMISQARNAGITVVLRTIYPDVATTTLANQIRRHNAWLTKYAAANHLHIIDTYGAAVDPTSTTGAWLAGYSADGTHATVAAAILAGKRALDGMTGLLRGPTTYNPWLPADNVAASQLLTNPLFLIDSNGDQLAEGWGTTSSGNVRSVTDAAITNASPTLTSATGNFVTDDIGRILTGTGIPANTVIKTVNSPTSVTMHVNATATATGVTVGIGNVGRQIITDPAVIGKVMRVVISGGTTNINQGISVDGINISVGDRMKWVGMMKFEGAASGTLIPQPQLTAIGTNPSYSANPVTYATGVDTGWFSYTVEITVPVGATLVRAACTTNAGTGTIYLAQQGLYNLTKLG